MYDFQRIKGVVEEYCSGHECECYLTEDNFKPAGTFGVNCILLHFQITKSQMNWDVYFYEGYSIYSQHNDSEKVVEASAACGSVRVNLSCDDDVKAFLDRCLSDRQITDRDLERAQQELLELQRQKADEVARQKADEQKAIDLIRMALDMKQGEMRTCVCNLKTLFLAGAPALLNPRTQALFKRLVLDEFDKILRQDF
jgi:hypothetical protein